jgi:hypothetical protein
MLWVDDNHLQQNLSERRAFNALGISIDPVETTEDAKSLLWPPYKGGSDSRYDLILSDISRSCDKNRPGKECITDPQSKENTTPCFLESNNPHAHGAGCALAQWLHDTFQDDMPPVIFYAARFKQEWGTPSYAVGVTNRVDRLLQLVLDALERRKVSNPAWDTAPG